MREIKVYEAFTDEVFDSFTECLNAEFLQLQYENRVACYNESFEKKIADLNNLRNHSVDFIFVSNLLDVTVHAVFENIDIYEDIPMPNLSTFPSSDLFTFDYGLEGWRRVEIVLDETKYKQAYLEEAIKNCK